MSLLACPTCDALHDVPDLEPGRKASCVRCGHVLVSGQTVSLDRTLATSLAVAILIVAALFFPFLSISEMGFGNQINLIEVAAAFLDGWLIPLTLAVTASIIAIPLIRVALLLYALVPLRLGRPRPRHAARAFRWSDALRPWSMAEIFILGTAVALVKVAELATIGFGPAFWAFCIAVGIIAFERQITDSAAIWSMLDDEG
ncbi:paraquat-inducible protein A [Roseobacter sp. HKCCA0434]|uniref:paraquat-inducible protein A n=1 Tax=Roseobacter sp. HKCCA0434 TaxID=3079297 RepID=UPI002905CE6B|nr:paraquat-inducible protein A [Roseobacter sp. HKCCA0434]